MFRNQTFTITYRLKSNNCKQPVQSHLKLIIECSDGRDISLWTISLNLTITNNLKQIFFKSLVLNCRINEKNSGTKRKKKCTYYFQKVKSSIWKV
jgi:hypothetical protein